MVFETLRKSIKNFSMKRTIAEYKRIIKISKKPSMDELKKIVRISSISMLAIGALGFLIQVFFQLFQGIII